jgi:hypothetical protein
MVEIIYLFVLAPAPFQAADYYRKAIAFIREHPDQYDDPELEAVFHRLVAKLDPSAPLD